MTDALDLLTRRNPVDEAGLPVRDARAVEDLARIMSEPAPPGRRPRRRAPRTVRLVAGAAGVAGVAALMGGLFLLRPDEGRTPPGEFLPPGAWGVQATVRVEPAADGPGLQEATRRAAEIIRARAAAMRIKDVTAEAVAPGAVRIVVPYALGRAEVTALTRPADVEVIDLDAHRLADSRRPARALRWLTGASRPGSAGTDWYLVTAGGEAIAEGPQPVRGAPRGPGVRWVRPPAGIRALKVSRGFLGLSDGAGIDYLPPYVVVGGTPEVTSEQVASVTRAPRGRLTIRLRRAVTIPPGAVVAHDGWIIGRAVAVPGDPTAVRVLGAGRYAIPPSFWALELTGGGMDAGMVVEAVRTLGDVPPRTGDATPEPGVAVRRLLGNGQLAITTGIVPGSRLRVLSTPARGRTAEIWEVLTAGDGTAFAVDGPGGVQGGVDCRLAPNARVIRTCARSEDTVAGRVAPSVARVEVRAPDGSVTAAVIQNGWFFAVATASPGVRIVALDDSGDVLGTTS